MIGAIPGRERRWDIDLAKGIAVLLVVLGHCYSGQNGAALKHWYYSFHLPVFFLLSGVLYAGREDAGWVGNPGRWFRKKARVLLIPYCLFGTLFQGVILALMYLGDRQAAKEQLGMRIGLILAGGSGAMWFLPVMLIALTLFQMLGRRRGGLWAIGILTVMGMFAPKHTPWVETLLRAFVGAAWIVLGYVTGPWWEKEIPWYAMLSLAGIQVVLAFCNPSVNIVYRSFACPVLYWINGLLGSWLLLQGCRFLLQRPSGVTICCCSLGKNSLVVLCTSGILIEILRAADHVLFGDLLPRLGIWEGLVLTALVTGMQFPLIWFFHRYLPWIFPGDGKKRKMET